MKNPPKRTRTQAGMGQVKVPAESRPTVEEAQLINAPAPSRGAHADGPQPRHTRAIESPPRRRTKEQQAAAPQRIDSPPPSAHPLSKPASRPPSRPPLDRGEPEDDIVETTRVSSKAAGAARSKRPSIREDHVGAVGAVGAVGNKRASSRPPPPIKGRFVPKLLRTKAEIAEAPIDHRAGFLLAHIDGTITVQGLVDIAGMSQEDVHEILERLRRLGIIDIR